MLILCFIELVESIDYVFHSHSRCANIVFYIARGEYRVCELYSHHIYNDIVFYRPSVSVFYSHESHIC